MRVTLKYAKRRIVIGLLMLISLSCTNKNEQEVASNDARFSINDTFDLPIDTLSILDSMNLQLSYKVERLDTVKNIDTFELKYLAFACDCQQWVDIRMHEAYENQDEEIYGEDSIGYYGFNVDDYGYFLRNADGVMPIEELAYSVHSRIRFFGTVKDEPDYFTNSLIPQRKQVITYYGYEVILPISVYGPFYDTRHYELQNDSSATMVRRMKLTIK